MLIDIQKYIFRHTSLSQFYGKQRNITAKWGSVAEWLARRTRDLEVAGSIPDQAML